MLRSELREIVRVGLPGPGFVHNGRGDEVTFGPTALVTDDLFG